MKRKYILLLLLAAVALLLTGCGCDHQWNEANCTTAKTCAECGEIEGSPLGHVWSEATCDAPQTCRNCGETTGEKLQHQWEGPVCESKCSLCGVKNSSATGHSWKDATCTEARKCTTCGTAEGSALGHDWVDATCLYPKYCQTCGAEEGEALGHSWTEDSTTVLGYCTVCDKAVEFFMDGDDVLAWTEFDVDTNGKLINPITYIFGKTVEWFQNGELQSWDSRDIVSTGSTFAYYVDGKIYYCSQAVFNLDFDTHGAILARVAHNYVNFFYYWGTEGFYISLTTADFMDQRGAAGAAVDAAGNKYVIVHKNSESNDPKLTYAVRTNW